jgi:hypothetical protein
LVALSLGATAVAYGIASLFAWQQYRDLRDQFPYVSMEERLPPPRTHLTASFPSAADERLNSLEGTIEYRDPLDHGDRRRLAHLEQLHEHAVQVFINQPGFGVARMVRVSEWTLKYGLRTDPPLPQPGTRSASSWSASTLELQPFRPQRRDSDKDLLWMHRNSVVDFANPKRFGFFKDRRHVAGFQVHQFSQVPASGAPGELQTLDLVGLVVHDEPVAYVSDHLPRMDELREAPTRPLNPFEATGLLVLRRGEDLFVRDTADSIQVLGAIRSAKQCVSCHGGQRGDLLGAFSYTFAR